MHGPRPQAGQTTGGLLVVCSVDPENGLSDTIEGDLGNDLLLGGGGSDTIWGNSGNDLALRGLRPGRPCRTWFITGRRLPDRGHLLPFDVALNNHTLHVDVDLHRVRRRTGATTSSPVTPVTTSSSAAPAPTGSPAAPATTTSIGGNTGAAVRRAPGIRWGRRLQRRRRLRGGLHRRRRPVRRPVASTARTAPASIGAACTYGDFLDGGSGNDVLAGDNATILRTGSTAGPRFRVLTGADILDHHGRRGQRRRRRLQRHAAVRVVRPERPRRAAAARPTATSSDPRGTTPRFVQLYDMDGAPPAAPTPTPTSPAAASDDVLFGQLGNDWIQGDGSVIDDLGQVTVDVQTRDTVLDPRASCEDYAGPGTDGDDYVEGNGGSDVDLRRARTGRPRRRQLVDVPPGSRQPASGRHRHHLRRRRHPRRHQRPRRPVGDRPRPRRRRDPRRQRQPLPARRRLRQRRQGRLRRRQAARCRSSLHLRQLLARAERIVPRAWTAARLHLRRGERPRDIGGSRPGRTARPATTSSSARPATTSSSATARTTRSSAAPATTGSTAAPATTRSSATTATSRPAATV